MENKITANNLLHLKNDTLDARKEKGEKKAIQHLFNKTKRLLRPEYQLSKEECAGIINEWLNPPPTYAELKAENERLKAERDELLKALVIAQQFMTDDVTSSFEELIGYTHKEANELVKAAINNITKP